LYRIPASDAAYTTSDFVPESVAKSARIAIHYFVGNSLNFDMPFVEKLIETVKKYPTLYDLTR
jgi:hypothetical protein